MPEQTRAPALRLGSLAPDFTADTTLGPLTFHAFIATSWCILFSHPEDYTPVCTTELAALARHSAAFAQRNCKLIGLSANSVESHGGWIRDINEIAGVALDFPIIGDRERIIAQLYDMLDHQDATNVDDRGIAYTIRSVFVIDPQKRIRVILAYPASTGRSTAELLRVVDSLQACDKYGVMTPVNWRVGEDVVVDEGVSDEEAREKFGGLKVVRPYLKFAKMPKGDGDGVVKV